MHDQGIESFHGRRSIRTTAASERISELTREKSYILKPQFTKAPVERSLSASDGYGFQRDAAETKEQFVKSRLG
jgi:hypothetical protein